MDLLVRGPASKRHHAGYTETTQRRQRSLDALPRRRASAWARQQCMREQRWEFHRPKSVLDDGAACSHVWARVSSCFRPRGLVRACSGRGLLEQRAQTRRRRHWTVNRRQAMDSPPTGGQFPCPSGAALGEPRCMHQVPAVNGRPARLSPTPTFTRCLAGPPPKNCPARGCDASRRRRTATKAAAMLPSRAIARSLPSAGARSQVQSRRATVRPLSPHPRPAGSVA